MQNLTETETAQGIRASWELGLLRYKLKYNQPAIYDAIKQARPQDIFVEVASRGLGKTTIGATLGLECIRQEEPGNVIMLSSSLKKQRILVEPKFDFLLQDCPPSLQPIHHSQDSYYTDPINHNNLYLVAAEKRRINDARGIHNVKLCLIDEAAFFGSEQDTYPLDYIIDAIITPMFQHSKNARVVAYSTPPEIPGHPFADLYSQAKLRGSASLHTIYQSGLPPEKIEEMRLRTKDPLVWRREYECEFIIDENIKIIPEFNEEMHVAEVLPPPYLDLLFKGSGTDLGAGDYTIEVFGYYDFPNNRIVIKREFFLQGSDVRTDNFATLHKQTVEDLHFQKRSAFWSDNSNLMLINDLATLHGIGMGVTEKENKVDWLNLVRILFREGKVIIDPSCKLLIETLKNGIWKDGLKKDYARTKALGHMDAIDALIYFIRNLDRSTNPFPLDYGFNPATHTYPQNWKNQARTQEGKALQRVFDKGKYMRRPGSRPSVFGGL